MSIVLNQDQSAAKDRLVDFITDDKGPNRIILTGSAGTGKTSTIVQVMKDIAKLNSMDRLIGSGKERNLEWYFTATTNKAKQAIQPSLPNQEVSTIHSMIGLRPYRGTLYRPKNFQEKLPKHKCVLVVDECSYIDQKLLEFIDQYVSDKIKIIFIGDANQLTPVKSTTCPVFEQGFELIKLTTLVRQTNAPKIGQLCDEFKQYIETNGQVDFPKVVLSDEITHLDAQQFDDLIKDVFITNAGLTLHNRVLAGTNQVVNKHNSTLFELANGRTELLPGDTVINNHYVKGIKTDDEVIIQSKTPFNTHIPYCNGHMYVLQSLTATSEVYVPSDPKVAMNVLSGMLDDVDNLDSMEANRLYDMYADIRPMYASTIHKSQGSTFQNVYIDLGSLGHATSAVALARLLYVGFSRASKHIYLTGDIV